MKGIRYSFNNNDRRVEIKRCSNSMHSFKAHFHSEVSIGLIEKGESRTEIDGKIYELTDKTFLIIPPNISHKCNPFDSENWNFRMLYFNIEWFKNGFDISSERIKFDYMKIGEKTFLEIIKLIDDIENNTINIENESKLLKYISVLINNNNINLQDDKSKDISRISEVKEYLSKNYLKDIKLDDLAQISQMSKYGLIRKFNNCYGLSPHQYITNLRINHAKKLLRSSEDFVGVALESGFYDQSHFIKNFKDYTGVTPLNYKRYL